jgi:peptidoglycan/LPS O-acetylase OafA/YrhL
MASTDLLGQHARGRENAFDVLRLLGATLVLVSHSYALLGFVEPHLGHSSLGAIGVEIFFAISGFLIAASWLSEPRIRAFLTKRALRILPALFVTITLSAVVLGPLLTERSAGAYISSSAPAEYVIKNMGAVMTGGTAMNVSYSLPGVFAGHPSDAVNGSLWTLPVEVRAYFIVMLLGLVGILLRWLWIPVAGGVALLVVAGSETDLLLVLFLVSSLLYVHRDRVPLHRAIALLALVAWIVGTTIEHGGALIVLAIPYLVMYVAYRAPAGVRALTRRGDVSYGLYLYAFPVQQLFVHWFPGLTGLELIALSLPTTYAVATLSWHVVERPALRLKSVLSKPAPRRATALARLDAKPVESS